MHLSALMSLGLSFNEPGPQGGVKRNAFCLQEEEVPVRRCPVAPAAQQAPG